MAEQHRTGAGQHDKQQGRRKPIPRDLPSQQWQGRPDHWDSPAAQPAREDDRLDEELPDTDESGTGKRGSPHSGNVHPEHPAPDEHPE